jgi:dihydrodipicolinate synthase/N-acetylneuraminate lyase
MTNTVFTGCIPALMTPCDEKGVPNFYALAAKGRELIDVGMHAVVYCGSMGDWPLLTDQERMQGVEALVAANVPVVVGTGAQVVHGYVRCGAKGAITGVGNALPREILRLVELCTRATAGDHEAYRLACELDQALAVLSTFDEGPDLVLYYKHLMVLEGGPEYEHQLDRSDALSQQQRAFLEDHWRQFRDWWAGWTGSSDT